MRRGIAFTLICFGLFLAVLGGAVRYWAYDRLVVVPVDLYSTLDLPGKATYLDMTSLKEKTGNVVARQTIRADVDASTDRVLVADLSQVISTADGQFIRASVERAAIDRRTGAAVNCCDESVDEKPAQHSGYLFKLPFDAPRADVMLWDGTTGTANPGRFAGTGTIAGHEVYKYVSEVPGQQIRTQADSGALVGEPRTFDAPVWNSSTKTLWVEPVTGTPLAVQVDTKTTLRNSRGQDKVTVFAATLRTDPAKPDAATLAMVEDSKRRIELVQQVPLIGLGAGATLASLGVALLLWRREAGAAALRRGARASRRERASRVAPVSPAVAIEAPPRPRRGGKHATGEFEIPTSLRTAELVRSREAERKAARRSRAPEGARAAEGVPAPQARPEPQARTWDVADVGPGRPVSPAPIADRPLSRYIRPYLDGDTGAHRRPEIPEQRDPLGERTGSHRAPDFGDGTGARRRPDPLDPDYDWLTEIRPEGLGGHGRLDPADWSPAKPPQQSLTDLLSADRVDGTKTEPPAVPPRRRKRYPDGW